MIAYILCAVLFFVTTAFSLAARGWMKRRFTPYRNVQAAEGLTGGTLARQLLDAADLSDVRVTPAPGHSADFYDSDFYDPKDRTLRLTAETMDGANVAALGAAAHEVGHAVQAADSGRKFWLRSDCMRMVDIGAQAAWILMQIGFLNRTPRGRCATPAAYTHLGIKPPNTAMAASEQMRLDMP